MIEKGSRNHKVGVGMLALAKRRAEELKALAENSEEGEDEDEEDEESEPEIQEHEESGPECAPLVARPWSVDLSSLPELQQVTRGKCWRPPFLLHSGLSRGG